MQAMSIRIFLILLLLIFIYPSSLIAGAERRTALVIGNGGYSSSPLKNAVNDASDIATNLQRLGFSVTLKKNVSHQEMEDAILEFGEQLKKGGVGLFFYAGHGVQKDSRNYLIPIGARINKDTDIKFQAVDAEMVLAEMGNASNNLNIVILDACRDNPFSKSFRSSSRGLAIISDAPKGTFITYSTSPGKVAADGSARNSPYTESLIKYMNTKGLPIEEVFKEVRKDLGKKTGGQQVPWELSSLEGQFYFSPGKSVKSDTAAKDEFDDENQKLEAEQSRLEKEKAAFAKQKALDEKRQQIAEEKERLEAEKEAARQAAEERKEAKKTLAMAPRPDQSDASGIQMVFVKGGCYPMGDTFGDGYANEKPVHEVCVSNFYIGKYEVTQGQWKMVMGSNPSDFIKDCGNDCPVARVSWNDIQEFIRKLNSESGKNYRLPTEAEWEYAARSGGKKQKYSGTNTYKNLDDYAWYDSNSGGRIHPVGQKRPNDLGIYDMSGNAWEWCNDWYRRNYYSQSTRNNPIGPSSGSVEKRDTKYDRESDLSIQRIFPGIKLDPFSGPYRVMRGGAWDSEPKSVRASYRDEGFFAGFRLSVSAQ